MGSYSSLFRKLTRLGLLKLVAPNRANLDFPSFKANARCEYRSSDVVHDTEDCGTLKRAIDGLMEVKAIVIRDEETPNVTNNPLPAHYNGLVIAMIYNGKDYMPTCKSIVAIATHEEKTKVVADAKKRENQVSQSSNSKIEPMPMEKLVLYVPKTSSEKKLILNIPKFYVSGGPPRIWARSENVGKAGKNCGD